MARVHADDRHNGVSLIASDLLQDEGRSSGSASSVDSDYVMLASLGTVQGTQIDRSFGGEHPFTEKRVA